MISIDPTIIIIMAEVISGLLVLVIGFAVWFFKSKSRDKQAVGALEDRIKRNAPKRKEALEALLPDDDESTPESRNEVVAELLDKENVFYGRLIDMYVKRDSSVMEGLDKMLHGYAASYVDIVTTMRDQTVTGDTALSEEMQVQLDGMAAEGTKLAAEMDRLRKENERLSAELKSAYGEIDQAMREYSSAFRADSIESPSAPAASASIAIGEAVSTVIMEEPEVSALEIAPSPPEESEGIVLSDSPVSTVAVVDDPDEGALADLLGDDLDEAVAVEDEDFMADVEAIADEEIELPKIDLSEPLVEDVIDLSVDK